MTKEISSELRCGKKKQKHEEFLSTPLRCKWFTFLNVISLNSEVFSIFHMQNKTFGLIQINYWKFQIHLKNKKTVFRVDLKWTETNFSAMQKSTPDGPKYFWERKGIIWKEFLVTVKARYFSTLSKTKKFCVWHINVEYF